MKDDYFLLATNPLQYDSEEMKWEKEGLDNSPSRFLPQDYLEKHLEIQGKTVMDIGCGMGQLFPLLKKLGADKVIGVDPSKNNIRVCKERYPYVELIESDLEHILTQEKVDAVTTVFIFEHVGNLSSAFKKISNILKPHGTLYLIHVDRDYSMTPRFDYTLDTQQIDESTTAIKTKRHVGIMYDLLRSPETYIENAKSAGFTLKQLHPMKPPVRLLEGSPKYKPFEDTVISHLIILEKGS